MQRLPAGKPPVPEMDFDSAVPVRVRVEERNSLNNRFKIDPLIRTRWVLGLSWLWGGTDTALGDALVLHEVMWGGKEGRSRGLGPG